MIRFIILILFLLFHEEKLISQKKIVYLDEKLNEISEKQYFSIDDDGTKYLKFTIENDTSIYYVLDKKEIKGKVSNELYSELIKIIEEDSRTYIDTTKIIVFNYYQGRDDCSKTANWDYLNKELAKYLKKINRKNNVSQFFVCKVNEGTKRFDDSKIKWYLDHNDVLGDTIFPFQYPCNSYLIIYPNKTYYACKGEHMLSSILDNLNY